MKKYIIYLIFFTVHVMNCQNPIPNAINNDVSFVNYNLLKKYNTNNINLPYKFSKIELKNNAFSTYKSSYHNANYYITKDTIDFIGFQTIPRNVFAGDKIDSYNPHGATHIGEAIFMGLFNWLTK